VAIATLAWTIYNDQRNRNHTTDPPPDVIARQIRITLRDQDTTLVVIHHLPLVIHSGRRSDWIEQTS
jgi:hypothetical protein